MRPKDAGAVLGVAPKTAIRWAQDGRLHAERTAGGNHVFSRYSVMKEADRIRGGVPAMVDQTAHRLAELAAARGLTLAHLQELIAGWWPQ